MKQQSFYIVIVIGSLFCCTLLTLHGAYAQDENAGEEMSLLDEYANKLQRLKQPLEDSAEKLQNLARKTTEKYPTLTFLGRILTRVGKFLMGASMVVSFLTAFFPHKEESEDLIDIKAKFNVVMSGITRVENSLKNLEFVVIHEITKASYAEYQRSIENLYMDWQYAVNAKDKSQESINRAYFMRQFELQYKNAALNLLKGMLGQYDGELNNDLLSMAKQRYQCNGLKLRYLCVVVTQIINQGLAVEGAFYSYMKMHERGEVEQILWEKRMDLLERRCEAILTECRMKWEDYVLPSVTQTYQQFNAASNSRLAEIMFLTLAKNYGQRAWFVFVYDDITSSGLHGMRTFDTRVSKDLQMKWRMNDKTFTVASLDMDLNSEFENKDNVMSTMLNLQKNLETCKVKFNTREETFPSAVFSALSNNTSSSYKPKFYYIVQSDQHLSFFGTPGRYIRVGLRVPQKCKGFPNNNYQLVAMG